jgi:hypothetical protein
MAAAVVVVVDVAMVADGANSNFVKSGRTVGRFLLYRSDEF